MMLVAGFLALCTINVLAISSGDTLHCDAQDARLGCTDWGMKRDPNDDRILLVNRLNCSQSGRIMPWATVPVRTEMYSVRSGREGGISNDVAYYHPGEYVTITVKATQYKRRYRGLLLYAVDSTNQVVGFFQFAPETEAVPFWTPTRWVGACASAGKGNGLLHKNADEKPYTINFRWKAPPAGTGAVTFKALFKSGPANDGYFYWPGNGGRGDLVLSERNAAIDGAVPAKTWFKASSHSQTCAQVCQAAGRSGVDTTLMAQTNNGGDGMSTYHPSAADAFGRTEVCRAPFVSSCAPDSPGIDTATSFCTFQPASCPSWRLTSEVSTRLRMCACLATAVQINPCAMDGNWPSTAAGSTAQLACSAGQTGTQTRKCSATGVWETAVSTCVTAPTCKDGIQNQGEFAIDCGGPCPACLNCPAINCGSHGTCVEGDPATCKCSDSWTGDRCDTAPPNPCDTWVCANGGTCQAQSTTTATCLCMGTWTGVHCDQLPAATCKDGIKNQGETGVDCGGPCPACDSFFWDVGNWSDCDRSCGGGFRTRGQTCKNSTGQVRPSTDCAAIHLPVTSEACNPDACPTYTWVSGNWDVCTTVCGGGSQTRKVECWSSIGPTVVTTVGLCTESTKPATTQACNTAACPAARWVSGAWSVCDKECGGGMQTRTNRCLNPDNSQAASTACTATPPATEQACNIFACVKYDWFMCPYWGPCTATCGGGDGMLGQQYRGLFCTSSDNKQVDSSLCDPLTKPKNVLTVCNTFPCWDFNWMANGDWGVCNGTHRERSFHCHAKDGAVALNSQCEHVPLPISAIPCTPGLVECYDIPPTPTFGSVSAAPKAQTSLPLLLAAASSMMSPRMGVASLALVGLFFAVPTEAHNWMHTPGRASFQASTVAPCQARKDGEIHAQVVRDQRFTMRFATGHDRDSYFVTVMGDDAEWLGNDKFEAMVDDYLAKAGANEDHLSPYKRRYHGYDGDRYADSYNNRNDAIGSQYTGVVDPTAANYPGHTRASATAIYSYTDAKLSNDKRASYYNPDYPWIISAARLPHLYHLPDDFDAFHWTIPTQSNVQDGHVIVHWRWSGYYDCIDVDLRSGTTPVAKPDGVLDANSHVWSQVDHCQYESPINILTQCMEVFDTVQPCINALGQGDWNKNARLGLNVVPFRNPASVNPDFRNQVDIPWRNGGCSSSWNKMPGTVAETQLDWATWLSSRTTVTTGTACTDSSVDTWDWDLKRAVARCVGIPSCTGVAWENEDGKTVSSPGNKHFQLCRGSSTSASAGWTLYRPKAITPVTLQSGNPVKTINFAPISRLAQTQPQTNMVTDIGYTYGTRNGATYGWSCPTQVDCPWCCDQWQCDNNGFLSGCCSGNIDYTYNYGANQPCPAPLGQLGDNKYFNYQVDNGVYQVTTRHMGDSSLDVDIGGCNIEGVRLVPNQNTPTPAGVQLTNLVEVTDGKLTFNGDAGLDGQCWFTNWIKFEYKGPVGTWNPTWMPAAVANPAWEQNAGKPVPVGLVTITNIDWFNNDGNPICSSWWLFKGSYCYPSKASGWFNDTQSQGAVVGVSNVSCVTGNCAGFVPCGWLQKPNQPWESRFYVDCNGKIGQYVVVKLPGSARYLTVNIEAYLFEPILPAGDNPLVCYGVEARPSAQTSPEYIISLDPEDPIFYSTCYVRNPNIIWLPVSGAPAPNPDRWRFNGRCISCDSFNRNKAANKENFADLPVPWVITDGQCVDCSAENQPLDPPKIVWTQTYMSDCDDPAKSPTNNRGLPACPSDITSCSKQLYARGRTDNEPTWGSAALTVSECQALAAQDPECSSTIEYIRPPTWNVCQCYRAHACCGTCTPNTWSGSDVRTTSFATNWQIYDRSVNPVPDAICSSGLKSADGSLCCPKTCQNAAGVNVCGNQNTCKTAVGGGTCCKGDQMNLFVNSCSVRGPPCKLT